MFSAFCSCASMFCPSKGAMSDCKSLCRSGSDEKNPTASPWAAAPTVVCTELAAFAKSESTEASTFRMLENPSESSPPTRSKTDTRSSKTPRKSYFASDRTDPTSPKSDDNSLDDISKLSLSPDNDIPISVTTDSNPDRSASITVVIIRSSFT